MSSSETGDFARLVRELDAWQASGVTASIWLRDDDAIAPSSSLDRLLGLTADYGCPALVAVIPKLATDALAKRLAAEKAVAPCVHGFRHRSHAPVGQKNAELIDNGAVRTPDHVLDELREGLGLLRAMFGSAATPILTPPWNRMSDAVAGRVHEAGFAAISGFGRRLFPSRLPQLNTHVDIVDWRGNRAGHAPAAVAELAAGALASAREAGAPAIGILTHHLAHDESAWQALEGLLEVLSRHPAARFADARDLLSGHAGIPSSRSGDERA